jgi:hypothetical protein
VSSGPIFLDSAGLYARGEPNIIVAPGESNKSTLVLATGVAFKYGVALAHMRPLHDVRPLFLDWEDNPDVSAARVKAIKAGLGITDCSPFPYYHLDRPLYEASRWLRAVVQRQRINMVYVDSAVPASGAEPESADAAQRLHRALRSLGPDVTSEITAHMSKGDMEKLNGGVFGSVMGPNLARSVWQVVKGEEDEDEGIQHGETREFTIALIQRKNNLGHRRRFGLRVSWEGREYEHPRVIRFTEARIADDPSLADRAGLKTLIANALKKQGKMTIDEIVEWTGAKLHSVKSTLRRMDDVVRIDEGGQGGRGKKTAWGLRAHQGDDHAGTH